MTTMRLDERFDRSTFEAVCGVTGDHDCCGAECPSALRPAGLPAPRGSLPCTREDGHRGDHVAAHVDGHVLARWPRTSPVDRVRK
jgi:hypothetical protein